MRRGAIRRLSGRILSLATAVMLALGFLAFTGGTALADPGLKRPLGGLAPGAIALIPLLRSEPEAEAGKVAA